MFWLIDLSLLINTVNSLIIFIREARYGFYKEGLKQATRYFVWGFLLIVVEISIITFIFFGGSPKSFACFYTEYSECSLNKIVNTLPVGESFRKPVIWIVNEGVDVSKSIIGCGSSNSKSEESDSFRYDIVEEKTSNAFNIEFKNDAALYDKNKKQLQFEFRVHNNKDIYYNINYLSINGCRNCVIGPKNSFPEQDNEFLKVFISALDETEINSMRFFLDLDRGYATISQRQISDNPFLEAGLRNLLNSFPGGTILLYDYQFSNLAATYNVLDIFSRALLNVEFEPDLVYMALSIYSIAGEEVSKQMLGKKTGRKVYKVLSTGKSGYDLINDANDFISRSDFWTIVSIISSSCELIAENKILRDKVIEVIKRKFGNKIATKIAALIDETLIGLWSRVFTLAPKSYDVVTTQLIEESTFKFEKQKGFNFWNLF